MLLTISKVVHMETTNFWNPILNMEWGRWRGHIIKGIGVWKLHGRKVDRKSYDRRGRGVGPSFLLTGEATGGSRKWHFCAPGTRLRQVLVALKRRNAQNGGNA